MKSRMFALATTALGAIALAGPAVAQNVPAQFVVSGAAAEKIQDFTTINLATAQRIAEACEQIAEQVASISITIWDNDGNEVYMDRMDGQDYINILTAEQKARTALADRASSRLRLNQALRDPCRTSFDRISWANSPIPGGYP